MHSTFDLRVDFGVGVSKGIKINDVILMDVVSVDIVMDLTAAWKLEEIDVSDNLVVSDLEKEDIVDFVVLATEGLLEIN